MAKDDDSNAPYAPENRAGDSGVPPGVRDASGRFAPGSSGNPGGRPKTAKAFRELQRERSFAVSDKLYVTALTGKGTITQVMAAKLIIERAWGRVPVEVSGPKGKPLDGAFYGAVRSTIEQAIADAQASELRAKIETDVPKN